MLFNERWDKIPHVFSSLTGSVNEILNRQITLKYVCLSLWGLVNFSDCEYFSSQIVCFPLLCNLMSKESKVWYSTIGHIDHDVAVVCPSSDMFCAQNFQLFWFYWCFAYLVKHVLQIDQLSKFVQVTLLVLAPLFFNL